MLYASKVLTTVKTRDREGFLGSINQSTLPLQNAGGVSLLLVLLWGGDQCNSLLLLEIAQDRETTEDREGQKS